MRRFRNILLVLGEVHLKDTSSLKAIELARSNQAMLTVVDVMPSSPFGRSLQHFSEKVERAHEKLLAERKLELEELLQGNLKDIEHKVVVLCGKPFIEIIRYVLAENCDLVIKSAERENRFHSILFGSTDLQLLRKCPCPVWMVKPDDKPASKKILAAVDLESFSDEPQQNQLNQQIVEIATSLACRESAELLVVNAYVIFDGGKLAKKLSRHFEEDSTLWVAEQRKNITLYQADFQELFEEFLEEKNRTSLKFSYHFVEGQAEDVIVDLAAKEEVDLVVMGTVGRSDLAGIFVGNTSELVLNQINCSVLAVKPPGFVSPVALEDE